MCRCLREDVRCEDVYHEPSQHTMHDNDNRLIITEGEPQLAIWAVHNTDAVAAIDYCYTVGDNGGGWYASVSPQSTCHSVLILCSPCAALS